VTEPRKTPPRLAIWQIPNAHIGRSNVVTQIEFLSSQLTEAALSIHFRIHPSRSAEPLAPGFDALLFPYSLFAFVVSSRVRRNHQVTRLAGGDPWSKTN
jgi:hypothetical protein